MLCGCKAKRVRGAGTGASMARASLTIVGRLLTDYFVTVSCIGSDGFVVIDVLLEPGM